MTDLAFRTDCTPEEWAAYLRGVGDGCAEAFALGVEHGTALANAEAFGAIRRAAEVAREHDRECLAALARNKELICERHEENAYECRRAIRAAIGSDKA